MKEKIKDIKSKMKPWHWWVTLIVIFTIVGALSISNLNKETYDTLYSGLTKDDSSEIQKYLSKNGIDYKINETSDIISVPADKVSTIKMELANQGLPGETNPGFELLDSTSIGSTKDDRENKYKRALKGQLEKDLVNGIESIEKATIHFETPEEENIFVSSDDEESKATVNIQIARGKELKEEQIKGIQYIVSAAIEGMKAENVVVVDSNGIAISDFEGTSGSNKQSQILNETESRIKNDIVKSLSTVFGSDSVRVTVRTEINFDEIVRNIEKYDPTGTLVSSHSNKELSETTETDGTTEVGTEANVDVPEYQNENGKNGYRNYSSKDELIENFEVGKTIETIKKNPELQYISVSVAVNQNMGVEEIAVLQKYVATAAGIFDKDKDGEWDNGEVNVTPFVFKVQEEKIDDVVAEEKGTLDEILDNKLLLFGGIAVIVILLIVIFIIVRGNKKKKEMMELSNQLKLEEEQRLRDKEMELRRLKMAEQEDEVDQEVRNLRENLNKEATAAAEENPKRTAEYVSKLINEG